MTKKIFSLLCCLFLLFLFMGCPADDDDNGDDTTTTTSTGEPTETVLLSDGNGTVPKTTFTNAAAGSWVVLTITNNSGEDRSGWGIGGVGNSYGDLDILSITPDSLPNGATITEDLTVATILANSNKDDVYFNIYNDCDLDSVVLFEPN